MAGQVPTVARAVVGRQRELKDAQAVIQAGLGGAGGLLLITGEAGIGKTRLVDELAAGTAAEGGRVVWGACTGDPGTPSFWPWTAILRACAESVGVALGEDLAPMLGASETGGPAEQLRLRLFDAVTALLRKVAGRQRLLIVVEDLQLAGSLALTLLRYLATSLRGHPVILVATLRIADRPGRPEQADAIEDLARAARTLPLFGLDHDEVAELVRVTVGAPAPPRLVTHLHERTGGNPLFVIEVAKLLAATQGRSDAERTPIPPTVRNVIAQRLALLGQRAVDLLTDASVIGQEFSIAVLAQVTGRPAAATADLLSEAVSTGLVHPVPDVDRFRFAHGLVRDVLYDRLPDAERRHRHRSIAAAIEELHRDDVDDHVFELADHHLLALPEVDPDRALDHARRAGERAMAMLAYEEAAHYLTRAADLAVPAGLDGTRRVELLLMLGDARMHTGDWPGATAEYERVAALARQRGRPDELARAALGLGAGLSGFEVRLFDQRQLGLLREALGQLGEDEPELRAWLLARLSVAESFEVTEDVRLARSREAIEVARRAGDARVLVYALSSYCDAIADPEHVEERLELATEMVDLGRRTGDLEGELLGRRFRVVALLETGDIPGVDAEIEAFSRAAARLRWPLVEWYPAMWHGMRANIEGRLADAEQAAEEVRAIGQRAGSVNAGILADLLDLQRLLEAGRPDDAYRVLGRFLDDPEGGPNAEAWRALPLTRMGRTAEARAVLDRLAGAGFPLVMDGAWLEVIASVADACAEVGHRDAAERLLPLLEPFADRFATGGIGTACFGSMAHHLGRLAHCVGRLDDAHAYLRRALEAHRRAGATLLIAHTQRQLAAVLLDRSAPGDRTEATAMLAAATEAYAQLGLDHLAGASTGAATDTDGARSALQREGDVWRVRYDGRETRIRHLKGLSVLARLLAEPGREFHVRDLVAAGEPVATAALSAGDTGPVLDDRARDAYRARLSDLEAEIEAAIAAADRGRGERAQAERDALVDQLTQAYGLGGRSRRVGDPAERARSAVTKQVRVAIQRIAEADPKLGLHLENSVRTGRFCCYTPERPVRWDV